MLVRKNTFAYHVKLSFNCSFTNLLDVCGLSVHCHSPSSFCLVLSVNQFLYHLLYRIQRRKVPLPITFTTPVKLSKNVLLTDNVFQIINLCKLPFTSQWKTKTALGRISMFLELLRYSSLNYLVNKIAGYCTCSIKIGNNIQKRPHANKKWLVWKPLVHRSTFPEGWCSVHTERCLLFYRFYTWPVCNSVPDAISVQIVFCSKQQCIMNTHKLSLVLSLLLCTFVLWTFCSVLNCGTVTFKIPAVPWDHRAKTQMLPKQFRAFH